MTTKRRRVVVVGGGAAGMVRAPALAYETTTANDSSLALQRWQSTLNSSM